VSLFTHKPVLLAEVLANLQLSDGGRVADGTLGGAGHAEAMLRAVLPTGFLYGCDRDGVAIEAAVGQLAQYAGRFEIRRGHYGELADWVPGESCDAVLLDLGVSSPQLDVPERGFSFSHDGPLDMRMDQRQPLTAEQIVNEYGETELANIFWEYGDETKSRKIANRIVRVRETGRITSTAQLAELVERILPRRGKKSHPATRMFQALRIAVNDEMGGLMRGLNAATTLLKPGGRLAVITFHSLEDRAVKRFGRALSAEYEWDDDAMRPDWSRPRQPILKIVKNKAIKAGAVELDENPRSRSAQLRVYEKLKGSA